MADVSFHPEAQTEYNAGLAWYQARNPQAAARFEAEFERTLELIATRPEMFAWYDEEHHFVVLRRFLYSIVYQIQAGHAYVIAVPHAKRQPDYWRGRS